MSTTFDPQAIEMHGWRQGAVLGPALVHEARQRAPRGLAIQDTDWLIVTSHDCDIVNQQLEKEPTVEVLPASLLRRKLDKHQLGGRNPRAMQVEVEDDLVSAVLSVNVHERWMLPRELLCTEAPARLLSVKPRRLVAEWLAKRYIRAAFPGSFDQRWRAKLRDWTDLLARHSRWMQGVYLRLSTIDELDATTPYECELIVAVPAAVRREADWLARREQIDHDVEGFWKQFAPSIELVGVEVLGTDELTLAYIERYQRFDADWISFADDSVVTPVAIDMMG